MEKALTAGKSSFIAGFGWGGGGSSSSSSHPPGGSGSGGASGGGGSGGSKGGSYSLSSWFGSLSTSKTKAGVSKGKPENPNAEGIGGKKWTKGMVGGGYLDEGDAMDHDDLEDERLIKLIQVGNSLTCPCVCDVVVGADVYT